MCKTFTVTEVDKGNVGEGDASVRTRQTKKQRINRTLAFLRYFHSVALAHNLLSALNSKRIGLQMINCKAGDTCFFLTVASFSHISLWTSEGLSGTPVCFPLGLPWGPHGTRTCGSHDRPGTRRTFCLPNAKTLNNKWVTNSKMTCLVFFFLEVKKFGLSETTQELWTGKHLCVCCYD